MNHYNNENNLLSAADSYVWSVASYREDNASLQQLQLLSWADAATCTYLLKNFCVCSFYQS